MIPLASQILSDITAYMKYAKYLPERKRREIWEETVDRNKAMHIAKFPELKEQIEEAYVSVYDKKVLPSMRSMQFAGKPIELNPARIYNCSGCNLDHIDAFSEAMFLLLSGAGFGYSVQRHHVRKLPPILGVQRPEGRQRKKRYLIGDSIEGWSDAIKVLVKSYFYNKREIDFDFRDIRAKGSLLLTSGGKAPGPEPLRECLTHITSIFENAIATRGACTQLRPIESHDIMCFIAEAVLSGGVRRSAMISLFSLEDTEMLECKFGNWYELNPQRALSNNSVILLRSQLDHPTFIALWEKIKASNSGEPGIFLSNSEEWICNPCNEVSLRSAQLCNLAEINFATVESQQDLETRARHASFIATLQASYTDFHYLRDIWKDTTEKEALIGVSLTGLATNNLYAFDLVRASKVVTKENRRVSKIIGINASARSCVVKPSGTASIILGTSSGVHAWYGKYYWRRVRVNKNEAIYNYLNTIHPELLEDDFFKPQTTSIIRVPQKAPEGAILRSEPALSTLERVKYMHTNWIRPAHKKGINGNNVSCTIQVKPDEWSVVGDWMWENRDSYNGISVLPYDNGSYVQPPFEECTKEEYTEAMKVLTQVELKYIVENEDNTDLQGEIACGGSGSCEVV
jgi:ribonucleoside-triphosphate reductase (thioredoxin)